MYLLSPTVHRKHLWDCSFTQVRNKAPHEPLIFVYSLGAYSQKVLAFASSLWVCSSCEIWFCSGSPLLYFPILVYFCLCSILTWSPKSELHKRYKSTSHPTPGTNLFSLISPTFVSYCTNEYDVCIFSHFPVFLPQKVACFTPDVAFFLLNNISWKPLHIS